MLLCHLEAELQECNWNISSRSCGALAAKADWRLTSLCLVQQLQFHWGRVSSRNWSGILENEIDVVYLLQLHPHRPYLGGKRGTTNTDYGVQLRFVSTYPSSFNLLVLFDLGDKYEARGNAHCILLWMCMSSSWRWHINSSKKTQNEVVIKTSYFVIEWQMLKLKLLPPRERKQRGFGTDWGNTSGAQIETCFSWGSILLLTL